jgi:hypothetical protein
MVADLFHGEGQAVDRQEESNSRFSPFSETRLKSHVTPKNALFHNLCVLSSTYLLYVSAILCRLLQVVDTNISLTQRAVKQATISLSVLWLSIVNYNFLKFCTTDTTTYMCLL